MLFLVNIQKRLHTLITIFEIRQVTEKPKVTISEKGYHQQKAVVLSLKWW